MTMREIERGRSPGGGVFNLFLSNKKRACEIGRKKNPGGQKQPRSVSMYRRIHRRQKEPAEKGTCCDIKTTHTALPREHLNIVFFFI